MTARGHRRVEAAGVLALVAAVVIGLALVPGVAAPQATRDRPDRPTNESIAPGGWTVSTSQAYLLSLMRESDLRYEQKFASQERAVEAALRSAALATSKAEAAAEIRAASQNEFRATLSDQATRLMPRAEAEAGLRANAEKIAALQSRLDSMQGSTAGSLQLWGLLIGVAFLALGAAAWANKNRETAAAKKAAP